MSRRRGIPDDGDDWAALDARVRALETTINFARATDFVPTWTSSGTVPAVGNGIIRGSFSRVGTMITFTSELVLGSTSTIGTGSYEMSLPVAARSGRRWALSVVAIDVSAAQAYAGSAMVNGGSSTVTMVIGSGQWSASAPFVPAVGDTFAVSGSYEAAV
jgi:hypothetical protein